MTRPVVVLKSSKAGGFPARAHDEEVRARFQAHAQDGLGRFGRALDILDAKTLPQRLVQLSTCCGPAA